MREKGFIIPLLMLVGAVFVVVAIIAAIAFFQFQLKPKSSPISTPATTATPTATELDETTDWKTYQDSTIGFTMRHPPHISVTARKDIPGRRYFTVGGVNKSPDTVATFLQKNPDFDASQISPETLPFLEPIVTYDLWIEIGNIILDTPVNLKEVAEAYKEEDLFGPGRGSFPKDFGQIEPIIIGGKSGYKITRLGGNVEYMIFLPGKDPSPILYIEARILPYTDPKSGAYTGEVSESPLSPRYDANKNLFNLMLSTFR